ncbi:phosphate ABC transporter periplasmic phosphate-binding protein PstS [Photobacterium aphoticum]|uniref:Phosphate ABC transporter periplasmic phosphate-binding protein PstS n=1 Tax=Photobacterium aphoticum TaxID=754436 RepID=A0A090QJH6_9GAMM|nr:phosphate ABC transporter periplasmic phosphate-binding protein PstS [Photobacterium aphoticum]
MFTRSTLYAIIAGLSFTASAEDTVTITGSTSASHIVEVLAETYTKATPDTNIEVQGIGSSAGIQALKKGVSDLGMSSRYLNTDEIKPDVETVLIAHDGIAWWCTKTIRSPTCHVNKSSRSIRVKSPIGKTSEG